MLDGIVNKISDIIIRRSDSKEEKAVIKTGSKTLIESYSRYKIDAKNVKNNQAEASDMFTRFFKSLSDKDKELMEEIVRKLYL